MSLPRSKTMTTQVRIAPSDIHRNEARGPIILETIWWPSDVIKRGLGLTGRPSPEAWREDLRSTAVRARDIVDFIAEDVVARFRLTVNADGSVRTDPLTISIPDRTIVVTD